MRFFQKTLTVLLAPSGAGKSTFIENLKREKEIVHVDRDLITENYLDNLPLGIPFDRRAFMAMERDLFDLCSDELYAALEGGAESIVVDYPSKEGDAWLKAAIKFCREYGYKVDLKAIHVDPAISAEETVNRNAAKLGGISQDDVDIFLQQNQAHVESWVSMYQYFPQAFDELLVLADSATLHHRFAGGGDVLPVIADWPNGANGGRNIYDSLAYMEFKGLAMITPEKTRLGIAFKAGSNNFFDFEVELRGHLPQPPQPASM